MKLDICVFFETVLKKFMILKNLTRMTGTLHEYLCRYNSILLSSS